MEYYNNILCFEAGWLVDNQITTPDNYKALAKRNQIQVVRRACRNTPALVAYDSMPDRFKAAIISTIGGDPYKLAKLNALEDLIEHNTAASKFFNEDFKLSDGRWLPKQTRGEYYTNVLILDAISRLMEKVAVKKAKGNKTGGQWKYYSELVQGLDRTQYPHTLPENDRSLERKHKTYIDEGYTSLIHANFLKGLRNAAKIDDEVKESVVSELIADHRNLDNEQVARLYNQIAEPMGWRKITAATVAVWREKLDYVTYAGRRGVNALYNNKLMQVKRSAPTMPLRYWTLDGWDVELMYRDVQRIQFKDKKTGEIKEKNVTTYWNRLVLEVVLDPCTKYPIGYAIGKAEDTDLITAALRNAVKHTKQLFGKMYRAHQIQSDKFAKKAMTPTYERVGGVYTPTSKKYGNAKAKVIEPYFKYLNKTYCQMQLNWSGFGIKAKAGSQPNGDIQNKYHNLFPDREGLIMQIVQMMEMERQAKREAYLTAWATVPESDKIELSDENYLITFGETTGHKNLLQGTGLNVTIKGIKRVYDCFDVNFRRHASTQWTVVYDPDNTSRAMAVNDDESLRFVLEEKHVQPMALKDRKEGDYKELARIGSFNDNTIDDIIEQRALSGNTVRELFAANPQLNQTAAKLMLVDSLGQNKNYKYIESGRKAERIEISPAEIVSRSKEKEKVQDIYDMM